MCVAGFRKKKLEAWHVCPEAIYAYADQRIWKTQMVHVRPEVDQLLRGAISQRKQIRFWYKDKERIAEPHDYGAQNGRAMLLTYQLAGESNSGKLPAWRWIQVPDIQGLEVLEATFPGSRPAPSGNHHRWDQLFISVSKPK